MNKRKSKDDRILAAIDIGAGLGAKIAIAESGAYETAYLCEKLLDHKQYGLDPERFTQKLVKTIKGMMLSCDIDFSRLCSIGVTIPGFADEHQMIISCTNLPFLNNFDIVTPLSKACDATVSIINDCDSGALAQWNIQQCELLYWAFGGGWGGAWVNREGAIQFPNLNWNGKDSSIHLTNEPGRTLKIVKKELKDIFNAYHVSWDIFIENYTREMNLTSGLVTGPDDDPDSLRAEVCISGKGLWRIFHAVVTKEDLNRMPEEIKDGLLNPGTAGKIIFKRYVDGDVMAGKAVSLFIEILGKTTIEILESAKKDGASLDIPVYLGGGLAKSSELFLPQVRQIIKEAGVQSEMYPCHFLKTEQNANLIGAFCLAAKNSL